MIVFIPLLFEIPFLSGVPFLFKGTLSKIWFPTLLISVPGIVLLTGLSEYRRYKDKKTENEKNVELADQGCEKTVFEGEEVVLCQKGSYAPDGDFCYLQEPSAKTKGESMSFRLISSEIYLFQSAFLSTFSIAFKMHMFDGGAHINETTFNDVIKTSTVNLSFLLISSAFNFIQIVHAWRVYYSALKNVLSAKTLCSHVKV